MPRPLPALTLVAVLLALSSCQDATAPVASGIFVLRDIAGDTPPVTYYSGTDGTYSVLADTIELDGAGTAYRTLLIRRTASIYGADTVYGTRRPMEYRAEGTRIEIGSFRPCPINALCVANDTGRIEGVTMTLGTARTGQLRRWTFGRIDPAAP